MINNVINLFKTDLKFSSVDANSGEESILVQKGNQMHVLQIWLILIYSLVFGIVNIFLGLYEQSVILFMGMPASMMAYVFVVKGYTLLSKIWNLIQINIILMLICMYTSTITGILAFFIPVIIGTQVSLQGKERKYGIYLSILTFINMVYLLIADLHLGNATPMTHEELEREIFINLTGATFATLIEIILILRLSNLIEEKMIEKSRQLNEKNIELQKANTELDNFVYSVSHDLRSPVVSVKGLLSLVLENKHLDESVAQYIRMGERSLVHLDDTIREILDYSRNTRLGPVIEKFDIRKIVEQVFTDLKFAAGSEMSFKADIIGTSEINGDKSRFNTVIRNIISNAVKYRRKNITDPYVHFTMKKIGDLIHIDIADNGEGISSANLEKVFDMFYRGTTTGMGTGLGLYICKEILEKMNGTISISSVQGEGTTVHIEIKEAV